MKPSKACQQCRRSKRKCVNDEDGTVGNAARCIPCQRRDISCSLSVKRSKQARLAPATLSSPEEDKDKNILAKKPISSVAGLISLYFKFIHDRPHSLFHEKTLWKDFHDRKLPESQLYALCSIGSRFSHDPQDHTQTVALMKRSSSLLAGHLETITLPTIQTCILLANLYAAEENNELEVLYFGKLD